MPLSFNSYESFTTNYYSCKKNILKILIHLRMRLCLIKNKCGPKPMTAIDIGMGRLFFDSWQLTFFMNIALELQTLLHCCGIINIAVLLWNYKHCCICRTLQTLLHCCGITNIAVSAELYKHCCTAVELQTLLHCCGIINIAKLLYLIYPIYLHEHQYGLLNISFHESMTVAARLE